MSQSLDAGEGFRMAQFMLRMALDEGPSRLQTPSSRRGRGGNRSLRASASPLLPEIGQSFDGQTGSSKPSGPETSGEPSSDSGFNGASAKLHRRERSVRFVPDSSSGGDAGGDPGSSGFGDSKAESLADETRGRDSVAFSDEPDTLAAIIAEIERRTKQLEMLVQKRNELAATIESEKQADENVSALYFLSFMQSFSSDVLVRIQ